MFGKENHGRVYTRKEEGWRPKRRWVQDITDELQMSTLDAGHLAYDRAVFRRVVKEAKFRQGHATELMNFKNYSKCYVPLKIILKYLTPLRIMLEVFHLL
jgi:hypothetical protein